MGSAYGASTRRFPSGYVKQFGRDRAKTDAAAGSDSDARSVDHRRAIDYQEKTGLVKRRDVQLPVDTRRGHQQDSPLLAPRLGQVLLTANSSYSKAYDTGAKARFSDGITNAAWKFKPTWYAVAKRDRTISPDLERLFAQRMNATTIELSTSHVPMLSRPFEVAAFIGRAASKIQ